jgi:predicted lactoylglutathione lyase
MPRMIFDNLPVRDLAAATAFYESIGASRNPQFSDETAAGMVFSDTIYVMLLTHEKYRGFTTKPIADRGVSEVLIALNHDSRGEVDAMIARGVDGGGRADPNPVQDLGFMYSRSLEDPDGHVWEMFWMDPAVVAGEEPMAATA